MIKLSDDEIAQHEITARSLNLARFGAKVETRATGDDGTRVLALLTDLPRIFDALRGDGWGDALLAGLAEIDKHSNTTGPGVPVPDLNRHPALAGEEP